MAITFGSPTNSGNMAGSSGTTLSHTCATNTKGLGVIITGADTSATDSVVTSVTYNGKPGGQCEYYKNGNYFISIWLVPNPYIGTANLVVTMGGSCTDLQVTALGMITTADYVVYEGSASSTSTSTSHLAMVAAPLGRVALGGFVGIISTTASFSVEAGSGVEIAGSEADMGSQCVGCAYSNAYNTPLNTYVTIRWAKSANFQSYALMSTFYEQFTPTTVLGTPNDLATGVSLTPTLNFTATDINSDAVEYQVQVDTVNTFVSGNLEDKLSTVDSGFSTGHPYASGVEKSFIKSVLNTIQNTVGTNSSVIGQGDKLKFGQSFIPDGGYLIRASFKGRKYSGENGIITAKLYAHSGTYGTSSIPTGDALAISNSINISSLPSTLANIYFNFDGTYFLENINYCIVFELESNIATEIIASINSPNSTSYSGNYSEYNTLWESIGSVDLLFSVSCISYLPLSASTTYYWRVRAIDPSGSNQWGAWSPVRSFTTLGGTANAAPTLSLNSPLDGATVTDTTPTLQFTGSDTDANNLEYQIQVDSINTFAGGSNWWALTPLTQSGTAGTFASSFGLCFSSDGFHMYIPDATAHTITQWDMTTPWDITTASVTAKVFTCSSYSPGPEGLWMKADGTVIFVFSAPAINWRGYDLTTPYDVSTAQYTGQKLVLTAAKEHSCAVSPDGMRMIISSRDSADHTVYQYNMSQGWNLDTATYAGSLDVTTYTYTVLSVWINAIGTQMYINSPTWDNLVRYTLSTPWELSTATFHSQMTVDFATQYSVMTFKADGRRMYQNTNTGVIQYDFETSLLVDADSTTDPGFLNLVTPGNAHPFTPGQMIGYTPQVEMDQGSYYWRVRTMDPSGTNAWTAWSSIRSLTISAVAGSLVKALNSLARSSIKAINSLSLAMVKKINGIQ